MQEPASVLGLEDARPVVAVRVVPTAAAAPLEPVREVEYRAVPFAVAVRVNGRSVLVTRGGDRLVILIQGRSDGDRRALNLGEHVVKRLGLDVLFLGNLFEHFFESFVGGVGRQELLTFRELLGDGGGGRGE